MISSNLLEELHKLSRGEKLRVIQLLAHDLSAEEELLVANASYEIWSPFDAPEAAATLLQMLDSEQTKDD